MSKILTKKIQTQLSAYFSSDTVMTKPELRCLKEMVLEVLKPVIAQLSRSNLHRCLQRNNISRLSDLLPKEEKKKYKKLVMF